jgi:predicted nucleic acid-binding Zn ribbon protein
MGDPFMNRTVRDVLTYRYMCDVETYASDVVKF